MRSLSREIDVRHCLLIVIDALRADKVGVYSRASEDVSRFLTRLGEGGVMFENAFTVINATDPSFTSMYTGRYPSSQGLVNHGEYVSAEEVRNVLALPFMQEILSRSGVKTIAVDWLGRWHRRGFNLYVNPRSSSHQTVKAILRETKRKTRIAGIIRPLVRLMPQATRRKHVASIPYTAEEAFTRVKDIIRRYRHERTFTLVHLWDTHTPYNAASKRYEEIRRRYRVKPWDRLLAEALEPVKGPWRDELVKMFSPDATLGDIIARYDSAVASVDSAIEDFLGFLEGLNLLDETLIIITSDHGESLVEHGIFFDHHGLYEPSIRIPLIIYNPRLTPHRVSSFAQNIDLMPTILEVFGARTNTTSNEGRSLLRLILEKEVKESQVRREAFVEEYYTERKIAVRTKRYKYVLAPDPRRATCRYCGYIHGNALEELYDLMKDPGENNNVADENNDIVRDLRKILEHHIKQIELKRRVRKLAEVLRKK